MEESEIEELAKKVGEDLVSRRSECEEVGHKEPSYFNYNPSSEGRPTVIRGQCNYCLAEIHRSPTPEEYERYEEFLKVLKQPMTI